MNERAITLRFRKSRRLLRKNKQAFTAFRRATIRVLKRFLGIKRNVPAPFVERLETRRNLYIIRLRGDIDMATIPGIGRMVVEAKQNRGLMEHNLLLDFKKVNHVDSSTIAALIVMLADLKNHRHTLGLVNIPSRLEKMLKILECRNLFSVYNSEASALKQLTA